LADQGFEVTKDVDSDGVAMLRGVIGGKKYQIYFDACTNGPCEVIQFHAGFTLDHKPSSARLNEWNRTKLVGRAYFGEDGDPYLDAIFTIEGGVTPENLGSMAAYWKAALNGYADFIGF